MALAANNLYFNDLLKQRFHTGLIILLGVISRTDETHIKMHVHRKRSGQKSGKHKSTVKHNQSTDGL